MIGQKSLGLVLSAALFASLCGGTARAQNCTAADFGAVVDQTAQALRDLNGSGSKRFQAKVAALRDKHGLSQADIEARATGLQDDKISEFNREIEVLVSQMDVLSQTPNAKITCEKLDELKRVRDRLLTIMGQKSGYMLAKVEAELDNPGSKPAQQAAAPLPPTPQPEPARTPPPAASPSAPPPQPEPARTPLAAPDARPRAAETRPPSDARTAANDARPEPAEQRPQAITPIRPNPPRPTVADAPPPGVPERSPGPSRQARNTVNAPTERSPLPPPDYDADRPASLAPPPGGLSLPPPDATQLPPPGDGDEEGFSINDIREAGRGVFGTITAEFAGAINYAFQTFGQPNAYISGVEGGAAFLAGLRYGKGTLHRKTAPEVQIFWQSPSAGLDFGAEGSRSLFLVYNLDDPYAIYGRFGGIGGSAYVAGGVGVNVLGKGRIVMVPIRSGLGLRLGANLAYVKFTERQTWNPF
jgi:hypothetical protein